MADDIYLSLLYISHLVESISTFDRAKRKLEGVKPKHMWIKDLQTIVVEGELTLNNLKQACGDYWKRPVESCEILKSICGPTVASLVQLNVKKDILLPLSIATFKNTRAPPGGGRVSEGEEGKKRVGES